LIYPALFIKIVAGCNGRQLVRQKIPFAGVFLPLSGILFAGCDFQPKFAASKNNNELLKQRMMIFS